MAQASSLEGSGDDMKLQRARAQEQGEMSHLGHTHRRLGSVFRLSDPEPTALPTQLMSPVFHQHQPLWPPEGDAPALFLSGSNSDPRAICFQVPSRWLSAGLK